MAVKYPDYPDKAWDDEAVKYAMTYLTYWPGGHFHPRGAMAIAGTIRHPARRLALQQHIDDLMKGTAWEDPRPGIVQFMEALGEAVVWPPPPDPVKVVWSKKGKRK